jgi:hypothetical protein
MSPTPDEWLVRTAQNLIAGPYTQAQIIQLIRDGQLSLQDEICPANGYWIFLHERDEVKRALAIELPRSMAPGGEEEITETQTEATSPEIEPASEGSLPGTPGGRLPALEPMPTVTDTEQTSMLSNSALRSFQAQQQQSETNGRKTLAAPVTHDLPSRMTSASPAHGPQATVIRGIEKPAAWKGIAWALLVSALGVLYFMLRSTR